MARGPTPPLAGGSEGVRSVLEQEIRRSRHLLSPGFGLTSEEAADRHKRGLYNKPASDKTKTIPRIILENTFSVFNLIIGMVILFLVVFYFRSRDGRLLLDSIGVFSVALLNTLIAVYQEIKAKMALDRVNLLLKRQVSVLRDDKLQDVDAKDVVIDDVIYLRRGDQVVVDATVVESNRLEIDESLLSGESEAVLKNNGDVLLSGSFCVSGNGYYKATRVGHDSLAARFTKTARRYKLTLTPLQRRINLIIKGLFVVCVFLVASAFLLRGDEGVSIDLARQVATIMLGLIPQGLVLMSSVTFALGVFRISRLGAIVQRLNAVESFSNVSVICMDKTGTLTQNKLSLHALTPLTEEIDAQAIRQSLSTYAQYGSDKNTTIMALHTCEPELNIEVIDELPFSSTRKLSILRIRRADRTIKTFIVGAYDVLVQRLEAGPRERARTAFEDNGLGLYRNLLFGCIVDDSTTLERLPETEITIHPLCIASITDEIREDARETIRLFEDKGIGLKILSGDSVTSVQSVCRAMGRDVGDAEVITGDRLDGLDASEFAKAVGDKMVFARLNPDHKLRIVRQLRQNGLYTVMIGDGVNDLPAIKEADMGIAMQEGSAITKEVADIVLLENRFALLPAIFDEGNKIVNSVSSVAKLLLTKNFMVICLGVLFIFFGMEFPLTPRRVTLINIFAITLPAVMIALKNNNTVPYRVFTTDVLSYVSLSACVIVSSGYAGFFLSIGLKEGRDDSVMVMLSIIVVACIANFLAVVIDRLDRDKLKHLVYSFFMLMVYFILVSMDANNIVVRGVKGFYEIREIGHNSWIVVATVGILTAISLITLQRLRIRLLKGDKPN
ncbi:MAG: HAD-IC family P-type ATPase [Nitrospirae bacterium]|nr:HAD-IC family P-type ATPase [Nitrospirota bacterium]